MPASTRIFATILVTVDAVAIVFGADPYPGITVGSGWGRLKPVIAGAVGVPMLADGVRVAGSPTQ